MTREPRAERDFELVSEFEPRGDQPTAVEERAERIQRTDRTQRLRSARSQTSLRPVRKRRPVRIHMIIRWCNHMLTGWLTG